MSNSPTTSHDHEPTLTDDAHSDSAPAVEKRYQTIKDFSWRLNRFSPPGWTVAAATFEDNDHCGAKCSVLDVTLEHESGATLDCNPIDPWAHHAGPEMYRRHRIILVPTDEPQQVVTFVEDAPNADLLPDRYDGLPACLEDAHETIELTPRSDVRATDRYVAENMPEHGCGSNIDSINDAIVGLIAAAQTVAIEYQKQQRLSSF